MYSCLELPEPLNNQARMDYLEMVLILDSRLLERVSYAGGSRDGLLLYQALALRMQVQAIGLRGE